MTKIEVKARNQLLALLMHIMGEKIWKNGRFSELNNLRSLLFFWKIEVWSGFRHKCYFSKMGFRPRKSPYLGNRIVFGGGSKGKVVAPSVLVIWPADKYYGSKTEN